jgi:hypothetical protein
LEKIFTIVLAFFACNSYAQITQPETTLVEEYSIGEFQRATRIVIGMQGSVFILDSDQNKIIRYNDLKALPISIGGYGWLGGSFDDPDGIATDGINIYVSDYGNHRIQRFDRDLNYISSLHTRDTSEAGCRFGYPIDIALSESGDLFIIDGENVRILKFNPLYSCERKFGDINSGEGKLNQPIKLIASENCLFAAERERIVMFYYFGNFIGSLVKGIVSGIKGFALDGEEIIIASKDTLWWLSLKGILQRTLPVNFLLTGDKIGQVQDIAVRSDRVFILSPAKLHIFKKYK